MSSGGQSVGSPRSLGILPVEEERERGIISGGEGVVMLGDLQLTAADRESKRERERGY